MLFKLLGLPLTLPAAGLKYCFEKVAELADAELTDDSLVKEQLLLLQLQLEEGEIEEEEFVEQETYLLQRLRAIREYRKALAQEELDARGEEVAELSRGGGRRRMIVETSLGDDEQ